MGHLERHEHLGELNLSTMQISPGKSHNVAEQRTVETENNQSVFPTARPVKPCRVRTLYKEEYDFWFCSCPSFVIFIPFLSFIGTCMTF